MVTNESLTDNKANEPAHAEFGQKNPDRLEKIMTVVEHLDELRTRLIRCLIYISIGVVIGLFFGKRILRFLEIPAGNIAFQALSMEEPILVFVKVAFYAGFILASPLLLLEACKFVAPGLTKTV